MVVVTGEEVWVAEPGPEGYGVDGEESWEWPDDR